MEGTPVQLRLGEIAAALAWWRGAGVDLDFVDEPVLWLAPPADPSSALPAAFMAPAAARVNSEPSGTRSAPVGGPREGWPKALAEFGAWWLAEPSLDGGTVRDRVPPRGPAGAEVMVIVAQPEPEDRDVLLSGPQGSLAAAVLAALGIGPEQAYFASALPRLTPGADWAALGAQGLGEVLRHHVALAAPQRIIAFGSVVPSLLGNDPAQTSGSSPTFKHENLSIPLFAARELAFVAAKPAAKARLWQRLLDFTGPDFPVRGSERTGSV